MNRDCEIKIKDDGTIDRRFTEEWSQSGIINLDKVPDLVVSLVQQRKSMIKYIEELHKLLEHIIKKNVVCPICLNTMCESEHK